MVDNSNIKKNRCISEIINIIKKHNIKLSDIITTYIKTFNMNFSNEDKLIQYSNYLDFITIKDILQKNIKDDYIFI
jgi:hypothetical protein